MRFPSKWKSLPRAERRLLVRCVPLVVGVRLALWVVPFRMTRRAVERLSRPQLAAKTAAAGDVDVAAIIRTVTRAARRVPRATCLTQAIAAAILLGRRGVPASIRFGVARDGGGKFIAHAWVESGGRIVLGGVTSPQRYAAFPALVVNGRTEPAAQIMSVAAS